MAVQVAKREETLWTKYVSWVAQRDVKEGAWPHHSDMLLSALFAVLCSDALYELWQAKNTSQQEGFVQGFAKLRALRACRRSKVGIMGS